MRLESFSQARQPTFGVIVADSPPGCFPDLLLRIEIWRRRRENQQLQARICFQYRPDFCSTMPGSPIPEQQDRHVRIGCQQRVQMPGCCLGVHRVHLGDQFVSGLQVQRAVEAGLGTAGVTAHRERLSARPPGCHRRGREV